MSLTHYDDLLHDDWAPLDPVPSAEFNSMAGILDAQLVGALQGLGTGCVEEDAWVVTAGAGLSVNITAGAGIAVSGDDYLFLQTTAAASVALSANATTVIYARAVTRVAAGDPDSREEAVVEWYTAATGGAVAGAVQVATVVTGAASVSSVQDDRSFIRALEALAALGSGDDSIAEIEAAIGSEYFGATPPAASLDARVDDLESAAASGDGVTAVFWGVLKRAAGVQTTIEQYVGEQIAAHVAEKHATEQQFLAEAEPWDEDAVNQARMVLRLTQLTDTTLPDDLLESVVVVWLIYGDGTGTTPDYVDEVNSTWLVTP